MEDFNGRALNKANNLNSHIIVTNARTKKFTSFTALVGDTMVLLKLP